MGEKLELRLKSPVGAEPAVYPWPLPVYVSTAPAPPGPGPRGAPRPPAAGVRRTPSGSAAVCGSRARRCRCLCPRLGVRAGGRAGPAAVCADTGVSFCLG